MVDIQCYDFEGKPIKSLYQWDVNQVITVRGIPSAASTALHFSNCYSKEALIPVVTETDSGLQTQIPNVLLEDDVPIYMYIYQYDYDGSAQTKYTIIIPLTPRPKPAEYEYIEQTGNMVRWGDLKYGV